MPLILLDLYLNEKRSKLCDIKSATILLGDLTIAFALVLVFEGVLYALFPLQMKKFMIITVAFIFTVSTHAWVREVQSKDVRVRYGAKTAVVPGIKNKSFAAGDMTGSRSKTCRRAFNAAKKYVLSSSNLAKVKSVCAQKFGAGAACGVEMKVLAKKGRNKGCSGTYRNNFWHKIGFTKKLQSGAAKSHQPHAVKFKMK